MVSFRVGVHDVVEEVQRIRFSGTGRVGFQSEQNPESGVTHTFGDNTLQHVGTESGRDVARCHDKTTTFREDSAESRGAKSSVVKSDTS